MRADAPELTQAFDRLCDKWLDSLHQKLGSSEFRSKQINDAVWGTVELLPWEVALLDTPLFQRMRGVRQLGLAYLVFPGAVHDRLEHLIGVVVTVDRMVDALERRIERWNGDKANSAANIPAISKADRYRLRLAAMFHDLGHGPFSHAIEPVLEVTSPLGELTSNDDWRKELEVVRQLLKAAYKLNSAPAPSEIVSIMMIYSEPVRSVFADGDFPLPNWEKTEAIQDQLVACVVGALDGPGADHLSALISSQLDADRMDYLSRDAHHAGLAIGFDTDRLLSRLEVLQMREDNTPMADDATRNRIAERKPHPVHQIGIAASGFGSFEQMLIGRTFLYDRLYHHHKVRAAEAMAQRMLLVAERDRGHRLSLDEIFLPVGDDTLIRIFAGEVTHKEVSMTSAPAKRLAEGILKRDLLHRAFAFRSRLIAMPDALAGEDGESTRNKLWRRVLKALNTLAQRYEVGAAIHARALEISEALHKEGVDRERMAAFVSSLQDIGPEQVIVDLPKRKADAIRIMARYPDGTLKVPEFSFNPVKWADAYDLQKRTGFVFCPRSVLPVIALASSIEFLTRFGVVMSSNANGFIKAGTMVDPSWLPPMVKLGLLDQDAADLLTEKKHSLLTLRVDDLRVPKNWAGENPNLAATLTAKANQHLQSGLTRADLDAFTTTLDALFSFIDLWFESDRVSSEVKDEADLQKQLRDHCRSARVSVREGTEVGGGETDLVLADRVLVENKYEGKETKNLGGAKKHAGKQARRYAIALTSQVMVTVVAVRLGRNQAVPQKTDLVEVRSPIETDGNRVEFRFTVPFGAPVPSSDKSED
ncbi:MAG: HD domain-containing protein [Pseudomonadota bacterium]